MTSFACAPAADAAARTSADVAPAWNTAHLSALRPGALKRASRCCDAMRPARAGAASPHFASPSDPVATAEHAPWLSPAPPTPPPSRRAARWRSSRVRSEAAALRCVAPLQKLQANRGSNPDRRLAYTCSARSLTVCICHHCFTPTYCIRPPH